MSITFCHLSIGMSSGSAPQLMPALLTRMSTLPYAAIVLSTTACTCSGTDTSQTMPSTLKPRPRKVSSVGVSHCSRRAHSISDAPASARPFGHFFAEPARAAGDDGHAAGEIEEFGQWTHEGPTELIESGVVSQRVLRFDAFTDHDPNSCAAACYSALFCCRALLWVWLTIQYLRDCQAWWLDFVADVDGNPRTRRRAPVRTPR